MKEKSLIHSWEKPMRFINIMIFIIALLGGTAFLIMSLMSDPENITDESLTVFMIFPLIVMIFVTMGRQYGKSRANSVEINEKQFPEVYEIVKEFSEKLELGYVPEVYLTQAGGAINAFATSFLSKKYISINSAIFEIAYLEHKDMDTVSFIIGHELAHIKRNHVTFKTAILESVARMIPIWRSAQSRAKEYTCDRHAAWLAPEGKKGLILLATGKHMYKHVDIEAYLEQSKHYKGFFFWLYNLLASHPAGPKRMRALLEEGNEGEMF